MSANLCSVRISIIFGYRDVLQSDGNQYSYLQNTHLQNKVSYTRSKICVTGKKNLAIKKKITHLLLLFHHACCFMKKGNSFYYEIPAFLGSEKKLVIN